MLNEDGLPFVTSAIAPLAAPGEAGANVAVNVAVAPAAIVVDVVKPFWPNPAPETLIPEKVSVALPVFCSVTC